MSGLTTSYRSPRYTPQRGAVGRLLARESPLRRMDWVLVAAAVALSGMGSLLVWSATRSRSDINHGDPQYFLVRHLLNLAVGMGLCVAIVLLGHHRLRTAVPFLYGFSVLAVLAVLLASGAPTRWLLGLIVVGGTGAFAVVQLHLLKQYQIARFAAFADPRLDPSGVGYNTAQARIAIGSGGLAGQGLFHGTQTTGQFVPEQQTDFVFTVAGEELGFLGAGLIILLLAVVLWRACRIARRADDLYSTIVAAGVVAWFGFQGFENIGMTLGIMPVAGIPLPFVSYGGSSMFAIWVGIGLLQSVRMQRPTAVS